MKNLESFTVSNESAITIIAGVNVLESFAHTQQVAQHLVELTNELGMPFVFKASFDKANRSDHRSYRGPGLLDGLDQLRELKSSLGIKIVTDVHELDQVEAVSQVVDWIQIPAFLSRQTNLLASAANSGRPILLKKMQMMSPAQAMQARSKCLALGATDVMICDRGTSFGYDNLILDIHGLWAMKREDIPIIVDVSHSLQTPGSLGTCTGGRGESIFEVARAAVSVGIGGLFFECHVEPEKALCDGPCALELEKLDGFLRQIHQLDGLVKSFD